MRQVLQAVGVYNAIWGLWAILWPNAAFDLAGVAAPNYPELWQCIGMIVGAYGAAYWFAARNPTGHWPVVLAGLIGKVLGPIGLVNAAWQGRLPWKLGWVCVFNDVVWWTPFGLILLAAYRQNVGKVISSSPDIQKLGLRAKSQFGVSLMEMSQRSPVMLVFLRHFGCTFCREALADLAAKREEIAETGTQLVLVHMGGEQEAAEFFARYDLADVPRVADPRQALYRAFGLRRGSWRALFGPKVWTRGFQAGVLDGHGVGREVGDAFQMPGIFLLFHGEVLRAFRHHSAADRPDYLAITMPEPLA